MSKTLTMNPGRVHLARIYFSTKSPKWVLLTGFLLYTNLLYALQEPQKLTISGSNISIQKVFHAIKKQTGLTVFYSDELLNDKERINLDFNEKELNEALEYLLKGRNISYEIRRNKVIVLSRVKEKETTTIVQPLVGTNVENIAVKGKVTDEKGDALPGVNILIKGTQRGLSTDADGKYAIEVPSENSILVFSFVGYLSQEVPVGKKNLIDISLRTDEKALKEVVVVGFGTQEKVNLTGAVAVVKGDRLINKAVTGTVDALQGVLPGVVVTKASGSPGQENYNIQIRGLTSATNNPVLVMIDGTEGNIKDVRPEDVESISVLKDAASAAIYGAKAAGGVILITTKAGKSGKVSVEFNS
jgi:TonB-dependent SusC/RagA subfamily outer membrane receptor